jgi:hypothetical protein
MEGVDGIQSTIDKTAAFVTALICVGLSVRLLTASPACRTDMGGIG